MSKLPPVFWARWSFLELLFRSASTVAGLVQLAGWLELHLILQSALSSNLFQILTLVMLLVPFLLITVTSVEIDSMKKGLPERQCLCPIPGTRVAVEQGEVGCQPIRLPAGIKTSGGLFSTVHFCSFGHQNLWRRLIAPLQSWAHVQVAHATSFFSPQTRAR